MNLSYFKCFWVDVCNIVYVIVNFYDVGELTKELKKGYILVYASFSSLGVLV